MATTNRKSGTDLKTGEFTPELALRRLFESDPCGVEFFQAVQLLERMYPDREPVGSFVHPSREVVRFTAYNRIAFPASEIQSFEWRENGPPVMCVNFLGLTGPSG